jgi:hypothetical protein
MWHAWGRRERFTGFWLGVQNVRDHCKVTFIPGAGIAQWNSAGLRAG